MRLLVFAKSPMPGNVKTRMQPFLTEQQSALLQRRLVEHCLAVTVCDDAPYTVELWVDGDHEFWLPLQQRYGINVFYQRGGGLGEKMSHALADALTRSSRVVVIGTDCPFIDRLYIEAGFKVLQNKDVVLGPAEDGGYVLLGLSQLHSMLFQHIKWGSSQVLSQTLQRVQSSGLSCEQLTALRDIDRPEDFSYLQQQMPQLVEAI